MVVKVDGLLEVIVISKITESKILRSILNLCPKRVTHTIDCYVNNIQISILTVHRGGVGRIDPGALGDLFKVSFDAFNITAIYIIET